MTTYHLTIFKSENHHFCGLSSYHVSRAIQLDDIFSNVFRKASGLVATFASRTTSPAPFSPRSSPMVSRSPYLVRLERVDNLGA